MNLNAVGLDQFDDQFIERDLALGGDARFDPAGHTRQLAVSAAIALGPRRKRPGVPPQLDQFIHELR